MVLVLRAYLAFTFIYAGLSKIGGRSFFEPATAGNIWQGDSVQVAATSGVPGSSATVSAASAAGHYEYGEALTPDGPQAYC